ncbi:DUF2934 domain-containing protein [Pseudomonas stutzeri]|jgi:pyruvate/2-oxoglutarate dehydrogenase complex dihydrolipoamide acyltransferase (E2) component|uniref:DUF2934 domain-containing protein n=1 Tax=Stutzerimonas stutzeri NF13 TaxID=1212548 RepID=M2VL98_STUST|nr:DUF2934 domain-containing protein [Stutzerimonas stutzeri]EME00394.1 hypothetical protein B381_09621 [Stutzerimonas stutzeri NF13]MBK3882894.1 DUF2934 domain-containing protein [Stutzerimonas stutzeri]MCQ4290371.1 DUF2934 domain-containing protein [Stutzerimonas stutzeri]WOF79206.1 DUF2934 domain-containing protein [Pseudomonas sp. FeN3W]
MSSEEQRIREFAYQIWQSEGCPEGEDERHWAMARKLVEAEHGAADAKPASRPRKTTKPTDAVPKAKAKAKDVKEPKDAPTAKPRASRAAPKAGTDAKAGTPETIKKTRTPRAKKES